MTMTTTQAIITIVAVVLGTMATRFIPFIIFPEGKNPPEFIKYLGTVLPYAAIGLLVIYCLKDVPASSTHGLPEAIAIVFIVLLHKWKKTPCTLLQKQSTGDFILNSFFQICQAIFRSASHVLSYSFSTAANSSSVPSLSWSLHEVFLSVPDLVQKDYQIQGSGKYLSVYVLHEMLSLHLYLPVLSPTVQNSDHPET